MAEQEDNKEYTNFFTDAPLKPQNVDEDPKTGIQQINNEIQAQMHKKKENAHVQSSKIQQFLTQIPQQIQEKQFNTLEVLRLKMQEKQQQSKQKNQEVKKQSANDDDTQKTTVKGEENKKEIQNKQIKTIDQTKSASESASIKKQQQQSKLKAKKTQTTPNNLNVEDVELERIKIQKQLLQVEQDISSLKKQMKVSHSEKINQMKMVHPRVHSSDHGNRKALQQGKPPKAIVNKQEVAEDQDALDKALDFVKRMQKDKRDHSKMMQEQIEKQNKLSQEQKLILQQQKMQRENLEKEEKRLKIQMKINQQKMLHEKRLQQQAMSNQIISDILKQPIESKDKDSQFQNVSIIQQQQQQQEQFQGNGNENVNSKIKQAPNQKKIMNLPPIKQSSSQTGAKYMNNKNQVIETAYTNLEKRKLELQEKRKGLHSEKMNDIALHNDSKNLEITKINEFSKNYDEFLKNKEKERSRDKQQKLLEWAKNAPKYPKTKIHILQESENEDLKRNQMLNQQNVKEYQERRKKYGQKISNELRQAKVPGQRVNVLNNNNRKYFANNNMQQMMQEFDNHDESIIHFKGTLPPEFALGGTKSDNLNIYQQQLPNNMSSSKMNASKQNLLLNNTNYQIKLNAEGKMPLFMEFERDINDSPPLPLSQKYHDYLKDIVEERNQDVQDNKIKVYREKDSWQQTLKNKNLEKNQKYYSVLSNVQEIDKRAKSRERLTRLTQNKDARTQSEIDEMYMSSIKAKLALLNNINQL